MKTCTNCQQSKPLDAFSLQKHGAQGRSSQCKTCRAEYNAALRERWAATPDTSAVTEKYCPGCARALPLTAYYRCRTNRLGVQGRCIECWKSDRARKYAANPGAFRRQARQWAKANPDRVRVSNRKIHLLVKYGITIEEYDAMLTAQGGGCAICGTTKPGSVRNRELVIFRVDHCHKTDAVRGLLCNACNTGIGMLGDDVDRVMAAAAYLLARKNVLVDAT